MNKQQDPDAAETVQTTNVPAVDLPRLIRLFDVTDDVLDAVENEVGMGCGAWDCVPPKEIIAAAWKFMPNSMTQIDNTPPPWMHRLWAHLHTEHGLTLTQDELFQIVRIVREDDVKRKSENSA